MLREVEANRGRRGVGTPTALLDGRSPARTRSRPERRLLAALRRAGLPEPETDVRLGDGSVDFLWRDAELVVEVDAYSTHSSPWAFERDRRKDAELTARGLTVQRFTADMVRDDVASVDCVDCRSSGCMVVSGAFLSHLAQPYNSAHGNGRASPGDAATHEVANQATPLEGYNTFEADRVLVEALRREGGDWAEHRVSEVGAFAGSARAIRWGFEANENPPKLRTHDRFGHRIDEVEFHPAWHELLERGCGLRPARPAVA